MRIDLVLQGLHASVEEETFLLFQLDLDAHAVENLQLDSDRGDARGVNCAVDPVVFWALYAEDGAGEISGQFCLHETQSDYGPEKHDLPVEQARPGNVALDQSENALIDEG